MTADRPATEPRTECRHPKVSPIDPWPDGPAWACDRCGESFQPEAAQGAAPRRFAALMETDALADDRFGSEGAAPRPHRHERDDHIGGYCLEGAAPRPYTGINQGTASGEFPPYKPEGAAPRAEGLDWRAESRRYDLLVVAANLMERWRDMPSDLFENEQAANVRLRRDRDKWLANYHDHATALASGAAPRAEGHNHKGNAGCFQSSCPAYGVAPRAEGLPSDLIERLYTALAHDRDEDTGDVWLHRDDADALFHFLAALPPIR